MRNIQFISYNGKYPTLCYGSLILNINNTQYSFECALASGGKAYFPNGFTNDPVIEHGPWKKIVILHSTSDINFNDEELDYIIKLINEHVAHGCCGGCI